MNKKLIALAIAAIPAAAMADVTLYGSIRGGIESNKTYAAGVTDANGNLKSNTQINDWTSRIGFKGNEDLGNGLKAIWQVENRVNVDGSSNTGFGTRDTFVGLEGAFGKFRLGKLSNYANSDMEQVDPGYYSGKSVAGLGYFTRLDGRVNNAVRYDTPNLAGFNGSLLYGTDETRKLVNGSNTNNQTWNLGLSYENSGFFGKYNYQHWGSAQELGTIQSWHRLEAGYNANNLYVAFGYQQTQGYDLAGQFYSADLAAGASAGNAKVKTKEYALTAGYTFGALTPYLSYAKGKNISVDSNTIDNTGYSQWVAGLNYDLSKRTSVYGAYGHVSWKGDTPSESSLGVGLIHNF
ncbi:porin [uncultured Aquitalea sp.]|uniref:porin n=1 Tax=uncultured Aquitalea sp. TaxID=540272 RepID=UPI0025DF078B|nr:porin [uncultured Aquitalea sp.]